MLRENSTQQSVMKETVQGIFLSRTPRSHLQFEPALQHVLALFSVNLLVKTAAHCMSTDHLLHAVLGHTKVLSDY